MARSSARTWSKRLLSIGVVAYGACIAFAATVVLTGAPRVTVPGLPVAQAAKLGDCLAKYTCGPSRSTLARTLNRCCSPVFGNQLPALCRP
jgi:hypothetical protein